MLATLKNYKLNITMSHPSPIHAKASIVLKRSNYCNEYISVQVFFYKKFGAYMFSLNFIKIMQISTTVTGHLTHEKLC